MKQLKSRAVSQYTRGLFTDVMRCRDHYIS